MCGKLGVAAGRPKVRVERADEEAGVAWTAERFTARPK